LGEASANPLSGYRCEQPLSSAPLVVITATTQATYVSSLFTPNSTPHHRSLSWPVHTWLVAAPSWGLGYSSRLGAAKKPPTGLQRRLLVQYQYLCWGPCAAAYPRGSGTEILDHHCHCHPPDYKRNCSCNGLLPKRQLSLEPSCEPQHPLFPLFPQTRWRACLLEDGINGSRRHKALTVRSIGTFDFRRRYSCNLTLLLQICACIKFRGRLPFSAVCKTPRPLLHNPRTPSLFV
jgi:hypothetical protein